MENVKAESLLSLMVALVLFGVVAGLIIGVPNNAESEVWQAESDIYELLDNW